MTVSALLPHPDIVDVHVGRTWRLVDRPSRAKPEIDQQVHRLMMFGGCRRAPDLTAIEIEPRPLAVDLHAIGVEAFVEGVGRHGDELVDRAGVFRFLAIPHVDRSGVTRGHMAVVLDDVYLGRVGRAIETDQPERGPKALARWKPGAHFEVSELLRKAFALSIDGCQQPAAPLPVRALGGFDAELAVLRGERKARLRIGEGRGPKAAVPRRVGDPARSRSPRGHVQRVEIFAEGLQEIRKVQFVAGFGAYEPWKSSQNKKQQEYSRHHVS